MTNSLKEPTTDQLVALEGHARSAHLMNTAVWPVFTTLFLAAIGILTEKLDVNNVAHAWTYLFLTLGGTYVCLQWWLSVRQTAMRYKRLWRRIRHLEGIKPSSRQSWLRDVFLDPGTAMWALRGESLPLLLGIIFLLLSILPFDLRPAIDNWASFIALVLFLSSLIGEASLERCERLKHESEESTPLPPST